MVLGPGCSTAVSLGARLQYGNQLYVQHGSWCWGQAAAPQLVLGTAAARQLVWGPGCSTAAGVGVRLQHGNQLQFGARLQHGDQLQLVLGTAAARQSVAVDVSGSHVLQHGSWCLGQAAAPQSIAVGLGARLQHGNQLQLVWGPGCSTAISCN